MLKSLKDWTKLEKILLFGSVILVSLVGIIFKSDLLTTLCSIVGIIPALLLAKGKNLGQIFGLLIVALYSIVSFRNGYYGEVIIYLCIMLPMYIVGIISWIRHQNKDTNTVEVNKIKMEVETPLIPTTLNIGDIVMAKCVENKKVQIENHPYLVQLVVDRVIDSTSLLGKEFSVEVRQISQQGKLCQVKYIRE